MVRKRFLVQWCCSCRAFVFVTCFSYSVENKYECMYLR